MRSHSKAPAAPRLLWVHPGSLSKLSAATWLEPTRQLRRLGWRVTLVATGSDGPSRLGGVSVRCVSAPNVYGLRLLVFHLKLLLLVARTWSRTDVILFHQLSAPWLLPLRLVRGVTGSRGPRIVMDTRTVPMCAKTWRTRLRGLCESAMQPLANHWADGQTAITERIARTVRMPRSRLWGVWPSGVDPDRFTPAQATRRWPGAGEPIGLIYVGALHYERNLGALCDAVVKANAQGLAFTLSLVGDGRERPALEDRARSTPGVIRVEKPVPHAEVPGLLALAHVGVLPFPDEEKFRVSSPIKLFEYMAAGMPVLATRIACHTDVIAGGSYVFWAEDAGVEGLLKSLRLVARARNRLECMGREAAFAAQAWTWQESAKKLAGALEYGLSR